MFNRYGMNTSCYRAKTLVEYFGEHLLLEVYLVYARHTGYCAFSFVPYELLHVKDVCLCFSVDFLPLFFSGCDICIKGPPERQILKAEAMIILQVVATHCRNFADISYGGYEGRLGERPNIKALVSRIREQYQQFSASELLWWRGLARLWEVEGFIREDYDMTRGGFVFQAAFLPLPILSNLQLVIVSSAVGFTSSFLLYLPILRKRQKKQIAAEKLRIIKQALEQADGRVLRYEERYLTKYVHIADAQEAMNEALEFAVRS
ncbi:hypothetical protein H5410_011329 [Solanum commersonii]|uniref:Uncharacterized protein n=1 Tax=Solanum commersonii TaxID=4109 RepID=A0A9J6APU9_SOLCO|nr:hypothetical protein H5410_011329 [Solanum commersonii]